MSWSKNHTEAGLPEGCGNGDCQTGAAILSRAISLDPIGNSAVGLFRRLPEEAVGLTLEQLQLGPGNAVLQSLCLGEMITAARIVVANQDQRRRFDVAKAVGRFPVMARNDQMNVLGEFGVGRPDLLEKCFDLLCILAAEVVGEKGAGVTVFFAQRFFEAFLDQAEHQPVRQPRHTIGPGARHLPRAARCHDQAFHPPGKIQRHL